MVKVSDPIKIGKLELKNRLAVAPTNVNYSTPDGYVTLKLVENFDRLAQGGWGWITVGVHTIERFYSITSQMGAIHEEACIPGLSEVAQAIHRWSIPCSIQVMSIGRQITPYIHLWPKEKYPRFEVRGIADGEYYGVLHRAIESTGMNEVPVNDRTSSLSDSGSGYVSRAFGDYLRLMGIRYIVSAPFHPQTNGPQTSGKVERYQQTLKGERNAIA